MATLVQFLAAGVNGAASGSATFLFRGTASSAANALYNDFEETTQPGTNVVTLDANGAAEIYCSAYVDCTIRNSAGTILRTVTVGNSDRVLEVRSDSFTGDDYDGDPSNEESQPVTLGNVLDRWNDSAGASDWKVLVGGVAVNLQTAFASFAGLFVNVKDPAYGATGGGVADDTTAVLAACSAVQAAGGGIVFFPPGTYNVTFLNPPAPEVTLMGCGPDASNIRGTSANTFVLSFTNNTASAFKRITGLKFSTTSSYTTLLDVEENQTIAIDNCEFDETNASAAAIRRIDVDGESSITCSNCKFNVEDASSAILNLSDDGESTISLSQCRFDVNSSFTGSVIDGPDVIASNCIFDASAVTGVSVYHHVDAESNENVGRYRGTFVGNKFIDGGSAGFVFDLTALGSSCHFSENGNSFYGFTAPAASSEKGHIYQITDTESGVPGDILLGSRKGRTVYLNNDQATFTASACLEAEHVVIEQTVTGAVQVTVPALIPGLSGRVIVYRTTGSGLLSARGNDLSDGYASVTSIQCTDVTNGILVAELPAGAAASLGYVTTSRANGVYRSLICGLFEHNIAV